MYLFRADPSGFAVIAADELGGKRYVGYMTLERAFIAAEQADNELAGEIDTAFGEFSERLAELQRMAGLRLIGELNMLCRGIEDEAIELTPRDAAMLTDALQRTMELARRF